MHKMEFKDYMIGFLLTLVCFISVTTFLTGTAENYGFDESYMKDERIDFSGMALSVDQLEKDAQSWEQSFRKDNIAFVFGAIVLESLWTVIKLVFAVPITMFGLIATGTIGVLGVPTLIVGALLDILIVGLIFAGWKALKNPQ